MPGVPRFRLRCWGARGTLPSPGPQALRYGGHTSCVEVRPANGTCVVFDAGSGIRAMGAQLLADRETRLSLRRRSAGSEVPDETIHLFLTHQHFDHIIGLPHFQPLRLANNRVVLRCGNATPDQLRALVDTVLAPPLYVDMPTVDDTLNVQPCNVGQSIPVGEGCNVLPICARHNGGAAIFRIGDARGPAIAFAPDNELSYASADAGVREWRASVVAELQDIPVLVHDAMYTDAEIGRYAGWGHSSAEEATQLAIECNAQRLVLFHHHPDRTDTEIDDLVWTCRSLAHRAGSRLQIDAAHEGMTLVV